MMILLVCLKMITIMKMWPAMLTIISEFSKIPLMHIIFDKDMISLVQNISNISYLNKVQSIELCPLES